MEYDMQELSSEEATFTPSDVERALWSSVVGTKLPSSQPNTEHKTHITISKSSRGKRKRWLMVHYLTAKSVSLNFLHWVKNDIVILITTSGVLLPSILQNLDDGNPPLIYLLLMYLCISFLLHFVIIKCLNLAVRFACKWCTKNLGQRPFYGSVFPIFKNQTS